MDNKLLLCILLYLICLTTFGSSQNDECQDRAVAGNAGYIPITGDRRSADYVTGQLDNLLCDRDKFSPDKWYRFVNSVGGRIPEECVPIGRCLTLNPIWMNGAHPTVVGDIVTRTACANYGFDGVNNANLCCEWDANIQVQLCAGVGEDDFYIYQMVSPPFCYGAYCGGEEPPPCDEDYVLENGTCVEKCPIQAGNPVLSDPIQLPPSRMGLPPNDFEFTCTVVYSNPVNGLEKFEVTWLLNSAEDTSRTRTILDSSTGYTAKILGSELVGELGKTIQCRVRSFRMAISGTSLCSSFYSNSYRMEVYPVLDSTPPIIIRDDAILSTEISFASTIPPVCAIPQIQCTVGGITVVTVNDGEDNNGAVFQENRRCRVDIFSTSWNSTTNLAVSNAPFLVLARRDSCVDEPQNFVLHFEQIQSFGDTPFLNYHIADIQFRTEDFAGGLCCSYNDPRIITFDGTLFDTQALGQFYLVRTNVPGSPRLYEVQVRQWSCFGGRASCNCGIAIREGRTVLGIDHCNHNSPAPLLIQYSTDVDPGAGIFMVDSRHYKICMSSGACTRVRLMGTSGNRWINLYVEALSRDRNRVTGLCGNFDGDRNNDRNTQVETHRIPEGQSFFEGYIPEINGAVEADYELCECQEDSGTDQTLIHCGPVNGDDCMPNRGTPAGGLTMLDPTQVVNGKRRRKRQTNTANSDNIVSLADITYPFEYGENLDRSTSDLNFPTPSGTTEQQAEIMCKNDIDSAVALTDCLTLVGQDAYNNLVTHCVDDLRITDNITVAGNIWEALEISCLRLAYMGVNSQGVILPRNSSGDFVNVLKETVQSGTCPNRCSNHGSCANSICTCHTGFSGPDCAVQNGAAPMVTGMKELCSVEKKCQQVSLYSENGDFTQMDNTVCRVVSADVDLADLLSPTRKSTISTETTFVTAWEIICALPNSTVHSDEAVVSGFWVSLSYDGIVYSDERFVTIYDPICIECSGNLQTCTQKANTCVIDGSCYAEGDWKEDDSNFECRPNVHSDQWTCISTACSEATTSATTSATTTGVLSTTTIETDETTKDEIMPTSSATTAALSTTTKGTDETTKDEIMPTSSATMAVTTTQASTAKSPVEETTMTEPTASLTTQDGSATSIEAQFTSTTTKIMTSHLDTTVEEESSAGTTTSDVNVPVASEEISTVTTSTAATRINPSTTTTTTISKMRTTTTVPEMTTNVPGQVTSIPESWSAWADGACTKPCDYGTQSGTRQCLQETCDGNSMRTRVCNSINCDEKGVEREEGVEMTILTSVTNVALMEETILREVVSIMNRHCRINPNTCCKQFTNNSISLTNLDLIKLEHTNMAAGYPRIVHSDKTRVKIIMKVIRSNALAQCSASNAERKRRSTTEVYFDKQVMETAILDNLQELATNLGYVIEDVSAAKTDLPNQSDKRNFAIILGPSIGGVFLLTCLLAVVACCYARTSASKSVRHAYSSDPTKQAFTHREGNPSRYFPSRISRSTSKKPYVN